MRQPEPKGIAHARVVGRAGNVREFPWIDGQVVEFFLGARVSNVDILCRSHAASTDDHMVVNIDFAPTFAELAGVGSPGADGISLLPLLQGSQGSWRSDFLLEHLQDISSSIPTYCGDRRQRIVANHQRDLNALLVRRLLTLQAATNAARTKHALIVRCFRRRFMGDLTLSKSTCTRRAEAHRYTLLFRFSWGAVANRF